MNAIDTNVVVRALLGDDPAQSAVARQVLVDGAFVPTTVFLETGWLLRSRYGFSRADVAVILEALLDMPTVGVDNAEALRWAVRRSATKGDLADLIHVASATGASRFLSFDKHLVRAVDAGSPVRAELLVG